jgi:hypothetical protein
MPGIFQDERREIASFALNPEGTGRLSPSDASQMACGGQAPRRHPLLPGGETRSRHDASLIGHRP